MDMVPRQYIEKYGPGQLTRQLQKAQHEQAIKEGKLFIQANETQTVAGKEKNIIIPVAKKAFELSKTLMNSLQDMGITTTTEPIPLTYPASAATIRTGLDLLSLYEPQNSTSFLNNLQGLSREHLIDVANLFSYLQVPNKVDEFVINRLSVITKNMNADETITALANLYSDLRKQIFVNRIIPYLKTKAIEKRGQNIHREYWSDGTDDRIIAPQLSPDGKYILYQSFNQGEDLILWNIEKGTITKTEYLTDYVSQDAKAFAYPDHNIIFFQVSPNSKHIAVGYEKNDDPLDTCVAIWDIETEAIIKEFSHINQIISAQFSPDGQKIIATYKGNSQNLVLWDVQTGKITKTLDGHQDDVMSAMFSLDGRYIISISKSDKNNLILWDAQTGERLSILNGHQGDVESAIFSPNSQYIISLSKLSNIKIVIMGKGIVSKRQLTLWDVETRTIKQQFSVQGSTIAQFSPDSSKILVNTNDENIFFWDIENQTEILLEPIQISNTTVKTIGPVPFSPDGRLIALTESNLANSSYNHYLTLQSTTTGKIIKSYPMTDAIKPLFSPDGTYIFAGITANNPIGQLILWRLISQQEKQDFDNLIHLGYNKIELIYRLCDAQEKNIAIDLRETEWKTIESLPPSIARLLDFNAIQLSQTTKQLYVQPIPYAIPPQTSPGYLERLRRYIASWVSYLKQ